MLLGGMGPIHSPVTDSGKVFAGLYALYAGLVFLVAAALLFAPVLHRLLHRFHWEQSAPIPRRMAQRCPTRDLPPRLGRGLLPRA
jgi:hypothetical protein